MPFENDLVVVQDLPVEYIRIIQWLKKATSRDPQQRGMTVFHFDRQTITTLDGYRIHRADFTKSWQYPFPEGKFKLRLSTQGIVLLQKVEGHPAYPKYDQTVQNALETGLSINQTGLIAVYARFSQRHILDAFSIGSQGMQIRLGGGAMVVEGILTSKNGDIKLLSIINPLSGPNGRLAWFEKVDRPAKG